MLRAGLRPKSPSRITLHGVLPLFSLLQARGPLRTIPQGPPALHWGLRMHLLGRLVPFARSTLSTWRKSPRYLPDSVKLQFLRLWRGMCAQSLAPRAPMYFPELSACCQPRCSAPHQVPIVHVPCWWQRIWLRKTPPEQGPRLQDLVCCVFFILGMILNDRF